MPDKLQLLSQVLLLVVLCFLCFDLSWFIYIFRDYPRQGFQFYKGPQYAEDVYFAGFNNNPYFNTGALSWAHSNSYFTAVYSSVKNALFNFDDSVSLIFFKFSYFL